MPPGCGLAQHTSFLTFPYKPRALQPMKVAISLWTMGGRFHSTLKSRISYLPSHVSIYCLIPTLKKQRTDNFRQASVQKKDFWGRHLAIHYEIHIRLLESPGSNSLSVLAERHFPIQCQPPLLSISASHCCPVSIQSRYSDIVGLGYISNPFGIISGVASFGNTPYISSLARQTPTALPFRLSLNLDTTHDPPPLKSIQVKVLLKSEVTITPEHSQDSSPLVNTTDTDLQELYKIQLDSRNILWDKEASSELSYRMVLEIPIIVSPKWALKPSFELCVASHKYLTVVRFTFFSTTAALCSMIIPIRFDPCNAPK